MLALLQLALLAYVPGAIAFRFPTRGRALRASLTPEERVFWHVVLSVSMTLAAGLLLAAAGRYTFPRLLMVMAGLSALLVVAARGRLRYRDAEASRPTWATAAPIAIAALGLYLYFPPSEYVMGGKDPGTYLNEGIQIAQRGSLLIHDDLVASLPPATRNLFFPSYHSATYYSLRYMGFFILDPVPGTVVGQFPHLYPMSIAIGYGLNGLSGARQAVGAWTILGLLALYCVAARLFGPSAAITAVALTAINVIVVWFARYPNAEMPTQALLLAAILASARGLSADSTFFRNVTAVLLGLLLSARFDVVLGMGAIAASGVLARLKAWRLGFSFYFLLGLLAIVNAVYLTTWLRAYAALPLAFTRDQLTRPAVAGALALAAFLWVVRRRTRADRLAAIVPVALAALLVVLAAYAWFLRAPGGRTALHDAIALRSYAWYITTFGVFATIAATAIIVPRYFWTDPAFFTTAAVYSVFFFYKIRIVPEHFWMSRRFVAVILPASMVMIVAGLKEGIGFAAGGMASTSARRALGLAARLGAAGVTAWLAWTFWSASAPVLRHVEYAGLIPQLEKLAARFGERDLVVFESRNSSDMHVLAVPLSYIYARNVLVLASPRPDRVAFKEFLAWARPRYDTVYFAGGGGTDLLARSIGVEPVASERFQVPEYESSLNAYPRGVRRKEFDFGLYRFVEPGGAPAPFALDVGTMDDLHVVRFHAKERRADGVTFRWTRDVSYVSLVGLSGDAATITLWLDDGRRPSGVPPCEVEVSLEERVLGRAAVGPDFKAYSFNLPRDLAGLAASRDDPLRLKIATSVWRPIDVLKTPDDRELGVMVDRVEVR